MLTDAQCKNAVCPPDKPRLRLTDGGGLYLEVGPKGSKRWFWKFRKGTSDSRLALGSYPDVGVAMARKAMAAAKLQRSEGVDPVQVRKVQKLKASNPAGDTFRVVALEWYGKQVPHWSDSHASRSLRQFERDLFPWLGERRLAEIEPLELLATLRRVEERGAVETADRCLMLARQVWHYGIATGRTTVDATTGLQKALTPYRGKHFAAIVEPAAFGELLRAIRAYKGSLVVRAALQLAALLFQRPGELRCAEWSEMDLDQGLWTIPAMRMKRGKDGKENGDPHLVPLPRQAIEILNELKPLTRATGLVFPGERRSSRKVEGQSLQPISDNTVRMALIRMGYGSDVHTWHGFRASGRTMLAEQLDFNPLLIEAGLAHAVKDANGRSYNRTVYLRQRTEMMQRWADYLDQLAAGAQVFPSRA